MKLTFGDCVLDLSTRQLERERKVVRLEPKVYELLEILIKRRPAVVTNEELDELLWPQVYVARTSLTRLVSELRTALGDTPRDSHIIRTAYKTGYAFCAPVYAEPSMRAAPAAIELVWNQQCFFLSDGEHLAGRDQAHTVTIDGSTVSRRHARIVVVSGRATVEDLESTNGTWVNGKRVVGPTPLAPGDQLALGSEKLQLRLRDTQAKTVKVDI